MFAAPISVVTLILRVHLKVTILSRKQLIEISKQITPLTIIFPDCSQSWNQASVSAMLPSPAMQLASLGPLYFLSLPLYGSSRI